MADSPNLPDLSLDLTLEHVDFYDNEYPEKWNSTLDKLSQFSANLAPWNVYLTDLKDQSLQYKNDAQQSSETAKNTVDTAVKNAQDIADTAVREAQDAANTAAKDAVDSVQQQLIDKIEALNKASAALVSALAAANMPVLTDTDIGKPLVWSGDQDGYQADSNDIIGGGVY